MWSKSKVELPTWRTFYQTINSSYSYDLRRGLRYDVEIWFADDI